MRKFFLLHAFLALGFSIHESAAQNIDGGSQPGELGMTNEAAADQTSSVSTTTNVVLRLKAGLSTPYTNSAGAVWLADQGFNDGDTIMRDPGTVIQGTKDQGLYLSEHYGMTSFSWKLPNGKYVAKLYFAETYEDITGSGQRVFSFNVQGHEFKDFDIWAKAGGAFRPYIQTVPVEVTNGVFRIDFTSNIENPEINAIEILQ